MCPKEASNKPVFLRLLLVPKEEFTVALDDRFHLVVLPLCFCCSFDCRGSPWQHSCQMGGISVVLPLCFSFHSALALGSAHCSWCGDSPPSGFFSCLPPHQCTKALKWYVWYTSTLPLLLFSSFLVSLTLLRKLFSKWQKVEWKEWAKQPRVCCCVLACLCPQAGCGQAVMLKLERSQQ